MDFNIELYIDTKYITQITTRRVPQINEIIMYDNDCYQVGDVISIIDNSVIRRYKVVATSNF